ncbi:unnamed protein product [Caenorhabditis auriculariae]|uniref:Uncharacterized protein n=1 Tax=Caenorhabditis auriculariae TaxID=2777116 RepID=A0A8S1HPM3_9PELO|nr:unnamed protein product [Caenorhabditis auriculariae]
MTCKEGDVQSPSRLQKQSKPFERKSDALRKKHEKDGKRIRNESRIDENCCQGQAEDDSLPYAERSLPQSKNKTLSMKKTRKLHAGTKDGSHLTTLFTDEKIFTVEPNKNGQNHPIIATDYQSACEEGKILNKTSHPASVMVFAGITADDKTPLIFVDPGVKVNQV